MNTGMAIFAISWMQIQKKVAHQITTLNVNTIILKLEKTYFHKVRFSKKFPNWENIWLDLKISQSLRWMYIEWKLCSYVIKYVAFFSYIATKFSFDTPYRNLTICLIIFQHWRIFREPYFIKIPPFYSSMNVVDAKSSELMGCFCLDLHRRDGIGPDVLIK